MSGRRWERGRIALLEGFGWEAERVSLREPCAQPSNAGGASAAVGSAETGLCSTLTCPDGRRRSGPHTGAEFVQQVQGRGAIRQAHVLDQFSVWPRRKLMLQAASAPACSRIRASSRSRRPRRYTRASDG